jgi:hypothetical protein
MDDLISTNATSWKAICRDCSASHLNRDALARCAAGWYTYHHIRANLQTVCSANPDIDTADRLVS